RREPAALARAISLVENQRDGFERLLSHVHAGLGRGGTRRIGITGPPGAGKSTLTERLIQRFRAQDLTVGVVAVDPTSPFTGGSLLGDRIRMESAGVDPSVFIRSMATRGAHGGLATTTEEVADLLVAFGFERISIERVVAGARRRWVGAAAARDGSVTGRRSGRAGRRTRPAFRPPPTERQARRPAPRAAGAAHPGSAGARGTAVDHGRHTDRAAARRPARRSSGRSAEPLRRRGRDP